ncbi:hypothetical protein GCM10023108_14000 [Saccharopolyspora hordei]
MSCDPRHRPGALTNGEGRNDVLSDTPVPAWLPSSLTLDGVSRAVGSSLLIVFLGMMVPVLAAAPFYVADRRREEQERQVDPPETTSTSSDD